MTDGHIEGQTRPTATPLKPSELPVFAHKRQIVDALKNHQVIVICGETGSGKTTQIPKICLAAGRGEHGIIACTQPRRIATVTVAERVSEEMAPHGDLVGWQHRFARKTPRNMKIKFMTDGILLAEIHNDPLLRRYDTIMVDEAHERTLNIDFILGCLKRILPRRRDLKVIVSSATLETSRFSEFFEGAPVINIPGRTFPVEVRYRETEEDGDLSDAVADAVEEALSEPAQGDILVFLPGERDIRNCMETLEGRALPNCVPIPLMASLPAADQRRAFTMAPGKRRIILSTNVAETSVTIPGIRYVIDSGLARISRYNHRAHVKRLHIEPIAQASAEQRKGRCGRIGPGICMRLYSEEDLLKRPQYTEPEIRRTSLAGLILSMLDWSLGDLDTFPFVQPPASSMIREGYKELLELQAIRENAPDRDGKPPACRYSITPLGRDIVRLPLEPRLSRMLLAAENEHCMRDTLTVVSALSCEDPLTRPVDKSDEADKCHAKFKTEKSDFAGILVLWRFFYNVSTPLSRSAIRKRCKENYVSYRKLLEWEDVRSQLETMLRMAKIDVNSSSDSDDGLHRALLSGLLSGIGIWDPEENEYKGANGTRFSIFPGSGLFRKPPKWIMCSELVDTARLYARRAAAINPDWIEPVARHICRYNYHSEYWDPKIGTARALRRVVLYGLLISDGVRSDISRINPELCRALFLRHGLVEGEFPKPVPQFVKLNLDFIGKHIAAAHKTRSTNPESELSVFVERYDDLLTEDCVNVPALRKWLAHAKKADVDRLVFSDADFEGNADASAGFPDHVDLAGRRMRLSYRHNPQGDDDGITCTVAMHDIPLLRLWHSDWLVPGAVQGKVVFMLQKLTRSTHAEIAAALGGVKGRDLRTIAGLCLESMETDMPLAHSLARMLSRECRVRVSPAIWDESSMPPQLLIRWRVVDDKNAQVFVSRSKKEVFDFHDELTALAPEVLTGATQPDFDGFREMRGIRTVTFPDVPERLWIGSALSPIHSYPALHDDGDSVSLRIFTTLAAAASSHREGVLRLIMLSENLRAPTASGALGKTQKKHRSKTVSLDAIPADVTFAAPSRSESILPPQPRLQADILRGALLSVYAPESDPLPRTSESLVGLIAARRIQFRKLHAEMATLVPAILDSAEACFAKLDNAPNLPEESIIDIAEQLGGLLYSGFAGVVPHEWLREYPRYLDAVRIRIERGNIDPAKELGKLDIVRPLWERQIRFDDGGAPFNSKAMEEHRWLLEELRVSVWAQELKTKTPVSVQRLDKVWAEVPFLV